MNTIPKTIVCFGDSNTHGYNSSNMGRFTEKERWTCLLADLLGSDYLVREEGLSGRTTSFEDPLFEGLNGFSYIHACMLTHEPLDLLIIMLGTNDVKERFGATPGNIAKGLERLVTKALRTSEAWRNQPNILIIAPPPIERRLFMKRISARKWELAAWKIQSARTALSKSCTAPQLSFS